MKSKGTCHVALDARTSDKLIASEDILVQPKTLSNFVVICLLYTSVKYQMSF